jgi:hypothetical protein
MYVFLSNIVLSYQYRVVVNNQGSTLSHHAQPRPSRVGQVPFVTYGV